jgi:hypothetical protein
VNALTLRNARDWRLLRSPENATLLERLEQYRALVTARGSIHGLRFLERATVEDVPDWGFIAGEHSYAVDVGNRFLPMLLTSAQTELAAVWRAYSGKEPPADRMFSVLNERLSERAPQVLSWQMWAGFLQRHALQAAMLTESYHRAVIGHPDKAAAFRTLATKQLGTLPTFALLDARWQVITDAGPAGTGLAATDEACGRAVPLLRSHPELVPTPLWMNLERVCSSQRSRAEVPNLTKWMPAAVPRGTAYAAEQRLRDLAPSVDSAETGALRALLTCSVLAVSSDVGARFHRTVTGAEVQQTCGTVLDYDVQALRWLTAFQQDDSPEGRLATQRKLCELDAEECLSLGVILAARREDADAVAAFTKGVAGAEDELTVSSSIGWFVDWELDHGRAAHAEELALRAASTWAYNGLATLGRFLERKGRFTEAEKTYRALAERYDAPNVVDAYYIRRSKRAPDARLAGQVEAATKKLFPEGLTTTSLSELQLLTPGELQDRRVGVLMTRLSDEDRHFGLENSDTILAIDGLRVHSYAQYECIRSFTDAEPMRVVVWRGGKFIELSSSYRRPRFGPPST